MQTRTQAMTSKFWSLLRLGFTMMRKGLISKRKLIMDVNLLMKKGRLLGKSIGKSFAIAFSVHHRRHAYSLTARTTSSRGFPAAVFGCPQQQKQKQGQSFYGFSGSSNGRRRSSSSSGSERSTRDELVQHLPRLRSPVLGDDNSPSITSWWVDSPSSPFSYDDILASPDQPLSVRVSDYLSDEDEVVSRPHVDDEAEEFIRRFHQQLRVQRLHYQEMDE